MMRRTPMKRTSFKPKAVMPAPRLHRQTVRVAHRLTRKPNYLISADPAAAVVKHDYVRSPKLMAAYRAIPCQHCGRDDGTVCGAHANWAIFGKGGSIKADDNRAASLCAHCHVPILDQGAELTRDERKAMFWAAHVKTVLELLARSLWPAGIPVPDIETNPFA